MNPDLQIAQVDQCPAGFDWGFGKKSLAQIRNNYKSWLARRGMVEDHARWQIGSFANRPERHRAKRVRRRLTDAPGLTLLEVAKQVGIAPQTVSKHIKRGLLVATKHGHKTVRVDVAELHKYRERIGR